MLTPTMIGAIPMGPWTPEQVQDLNVKMDVVSDRVMEKVNALTGSAEANFRDHTAIRNEMGNQSAALQLEMATKIEEMKGGLSELKALDVKRGDEYLDQVNEHFKTRTEVDKANAQMQEILAKMTYLDTVMKNIQQENVTVNGANGCDDAAASTSTSSRTRRTRSTARDHKEAGRME